MNSGAYVPKSKEKRKRRRFYLMPIYVFVVFYLTAAGASWFFLESPFFKIREIKVLGNSAVSETEIMDLLKSGVPDRGFWELVLGFNNFLAWPAAVSSSSLVLLPEVESLEIDKNYRDRSLTVKVGERKPSDIWCLHAALANADTARRDMDKNLYESTCWWFDDNGVVFKKAILSEGGLIGVIHDYSQGKLGLNLKILPDEFVPNVISIIKVLEESELSVKEIVLKDLSLRELEVSTYDGPKIYFSLTFPADNFLQVINDFRSKTGLQNLKYLDFRVENKLYYK